MAGNTSGLKYEKVVGIRSRFSEFVNFTFVAIAIRQWRGHHLQPEGRDVCRISSVAEPGSCLVSVVFEYSAGGICAATLRQDTGGRH